MNNDPVLSRAVAKVISVDASLTKPLVYQIKGVRTRLDEFVDLIGTQMLAIASMVRVRNFKVLAQEFISSI
jgi:hypothetical protein